MVWGNATGIITAMAHSHALWYRGIMEFIAKSVRIGEDSSRYELAVSMFSFAALP